ncbi:MAG: hypothetical protein IJW68_04230 [Bacteroidaceae bacterium]|nr:hypothetical protein [Bacteroidaceae bacterium]
MKNYTTYFFLVVLLLCSCGEDRTYQYLELTEENQWIFNKMQEIYLWNDSIKRPKRQDFFAKSSTFFNSLLQRGDVFSHFSDSALSTSYGIKYMMYRDPLGKQSSRYYALVKFVEPNSPAYAAGLRRGDWIGQIGNNRLNASNYGYLDRGAATTLHTWNIELNDENMEYQWVAGDTLQMEAATELVPTDVYLDSIYTQRNRKIGYLVCNNFSDVSTQGLFTTIEKFKQQQITDLIIDLRYNNFGNISVANTFANAIVPAEHSGTTFCTLTYNNLNSDKDTTYNYSVSGNTLAVEKIYLICGRETRGASEAFISSMKATLGENNTIIVGETTYGEDLITQTIASPYNFTISPAVAYVGNAEKAPLFANGVDPTHTINEFSDFYKIYPLGSKQEYILYNLFYFIINGSLPQE